VVSNRNELRRQMWDEIGLALEPPAGSPDDARTKDVMWDNSSSPTLLGMARGEC
jgi:hypothetical protein